MKKLAYSIPIIVGALLWLLLVFLGVARIKVEEQLSLQQAAVLRLEKQLTLDKNYIAFLEKRLAEKPKVKIVYKKAKQRDLNRLVADSCVAMLPERIVTRKDNRVSLIVGSGPNGLIKKNAGTRIEQDFTPVVGVGYDRMINDVTSVGIFGLVNGTVAVKIGSDF
jgi:hypothetical protein